MLTTRGWWSLGLLAPMLAACSAPTPAPAPPRGSDEAARQRAEAGEKAAEDQVLETTRVATLETRVDGLQKELDEIKASRAQLDADIVNQRLSALEASLGNHESEAAAPAPPAAPAGRPTPATPAPARPRLVKQHLSLDLSDGH